MNKGAEKPSALVLVCAGGCGKTTNDVSPYEFWVGKVERIEGTLIPLWTCRDCKEPVKKKLVRKCPHCKKDSPWDTVFCIYCRRRIL